MFLQVSKEERDELHELLQELLAEGQLMLTSKGKYMKSKGFVHVLNADFVTYITDWKRNNLIKKGQVSPQHVP